ncbi:uncharacterized protein MEPE_01818 [Melanopsichium pennsylvanicum]|uniref:MARVEL domain-containing protein n=2 Tax=Melanopsichium pennsylvanicum TaxID=63383 RepID=A0AAJ4XJD9_9BASI|nr:conserved hypothetical protein [Melanopsichium pennsylvanicum 4]SNX83112.1 uncharacterized protein MEPE_01818 [Melanopsichium pennsylvanicum]
MPDFLSLKTVWGKLDTGSSDQQNPAGPYGNGIGNTAVGGGGLVISADDDRVARVNMILRALQVFFALVTLLIAVYMATFQTKWVKSPSGLTGLLLFLSSLSLVVSTIFLIVPIIYERSGYRYMKSFSRALSEARVGMVCNGVVGFLLLILSMTQTISAYTSSGCKDHTKDPHAGGKDSADFVKQLGGWCRTKRAEAAFCWFLWVTWFLSLLLFLRQWRLERKNGPRIPPFVHPNQDSAFEPINDLDDEDAFDETTKTTRYGDGGDGRYGVAPIQNAGGQPHLASYDRRGSNPLADIEAKYGMSPAYNPDPFADDGRAATPGYTRPSYDYNAYGSGGILGGYTADPYNAINYQLSSGRASVGPPPQLPSLGYGYH